MGAFEHNIVEDVAVNRDAQRLAHALVLAERRVRQFAIVLVQRHALIAKARRRKELQAAIALYRFTSVAARRSSMSTSPERRLARRTVVSGMAR